MASRFSKIQNTSVENFAQFCDAQSRVRASLLKGVGLKIQCTTVRVGSNPTARMSYRPFGLLLAGGYHRGCTIKITGESKQKSTPGEGGSKLVIPCARLAQ
jgi:hypothetical protein